MERIHRSWPHLLREDVVVQGHVVHVGQVSFQHEIHNVLLEQSEVVRIGFSQENQTSTFVIEWNGGGPHGSDDVWPSLLTPISQRELNE